MLKLASASLKPANQLLLSKAEQSKPKKCIKQLSFSFIQAIALCKASILGVRIRPLIILIIFNTSFLANICNKT